MEKTKIIFIEDFHGVRGFYDWQITQLKKIKPQAVCLEMLPCEKKFILLCEKIPRGDISLEEFKEKTRWENHWGTFNGYSLLFKYLRSAKTPIYPIDQKLKERKNLAQRERQIIKNLKSGKDVKALIDQSRIELFWIREAVFSQNILNLVRTKKIKKLAVLVGGNHTERLSHFFNFLDEFEAKERRISKKMRKEIYALFDKTHLKFAQERNILAMKSPPLVPINVLRFSETKKAKTS